MRKIFCFTGLLASVMLAVPLFVTGQDIDNSGINYDNLFFYSYSYSSANPYGPKGPIEKVFLSIVSDELIIKKKADVSQDKIENAVLIKMPTAQISWIRDDVCLVIADKQAIENGKGYLLSDDDIVSLRPVYTRRTYVDLMKLYPVNRVATYGFDDLISVVIDDKKVNEAEELIASLGFQTESPIESDPLQRFIYASKESDVIAIANSMYESGCFLSSRPSTYIVVKDYNDVQFDKSELDFYYSNGSKQYLYKSPGRFIIKKGNDTDKSEIEAVINKYLSAPSYVWITDNLCKVEIDESLVEETINSIRNEEAVISVSRGYMFPSEYEHTLVDGTDYPTDNYHDDNIILKMKDGVPESVKDSLKKALNLTVSEENGVFCTWTAQKTDNILNICNELYESGLVEWAEPNWVAGFKVIWHDSSNSGTTIVNNHTGLIETRIHYFDMLGRIIERPSGLTIVVTEYSDGSISARKFLLEEQ